VKSNLLIAIVSFCGLQICPQIVSAQSIYSGTPNYNETSPVYNTGGASSTTYNYPSGSNTTTTTPNQFPLIPANPANSLLPAWSVGGSGSGSYSGSNYGYNTGNNYSGSSSYSYNSNGYNFPNNNGQCGFSTYADASKANTGASSDSNNVDLNSNGFVARVGVSMNQQKCINHQDLMNTQSQTEQRKAEIIELGQSQRMCIQSIVETKRINQDTTQLEQLCKALTDKLINMK
jgi:hypothetical protein